MGELLTNCDSNLICFNLDLLVKGGPPVVGEKIRLKDKKVNALFRIFKVLLHCSQKLHFFTFLLKRKKVLVNFVKLLLSLHTETTG